MLAQEPLRTIANRFGPSKTALIRHRDSHLHQALTRALVRKQEAVPVQSPSKAITIKHGEAMEDRLLHFDLSQREKRLEVLDDMHGRLRQVVIERAEDFAGSGVPGGETGLLVRKVKMIGSGPAAREIVEYEVDTGLLKEMRAHLEQAARELGQSQEMGCVKAGTVSVNNSQVVMYMPTPAPGGSAAPVAIDLPRHMRGFETRREGARDDPPTT